MGYCRYGETLSASTSSSYLATPSAEAQPTSKSAHTCDRKQNGYDSVHTVDLGINAGVTILLQFAGKPRDGGFNTTLLHLGAFGLFFFGILDSLPLPIFAGSDILTAILAAGHHDPWYEYAAVATAGALIGAYVTLRLARRAGIAYLHSKFGSNRVPSILRLFERWGTGALVVSTAVPFLPASIFFAAAGASGYPTRKYFTIVLFCRALRYSFIAILADHYGHQFIRVFRHPAQYWGWLLFSAAIIAGAVAIGVVINKRLETPPSSD
jgi:membrane protein YqaA with SNARE-associated domain